MLMRADDDICRAACHYLWIDVVEIFTYRDYVKLNIYVVADR
jgi:hypothetical protein